MYIFLTEFNVAHVVNIKLAFMDWCFYNVVILIN